MTATAAPNQESQVIPLDIPTVPGAAFGGGFYAGRYQIDGVEYALIASPKASGDHVSAVWNGSYAHVDGAKSYCDGLANTKAMADAGSELAKWALGLDIDGLADWYLPAVDELELLYRAFKPSADENSGWARSGINLSALPPTWPYMPDFPMQTTVETFRAGSVEAFEAGLYWSSTQHAALSGYAWFQTFGDGGQDNWTKNGQCRARAVRRLPI